MWTSIQNLGYIILTAQFVKQNWNLQKKLLISVFFHINTR